LDVVKANLERRLLKKFSGMQISENENFDTVNFASKINIEIIFSTARKQVLRQIVVIFYTHFSNEKEKTQGA